MSHSRLLAQREIQSSHRVIKRIALTATFSALYLVFRAIPTFPNVLFPGTTFRAGDIVAPLYGVVLGPLLGPLAIVIGTIAGYPTVAPPVFLGLDFLPASVCAATVGLVVRGRRAAAAGLFGGVLTIFILLPFTAILISVDGAQIPYNWLHIAGLAVLVSPLGRYAARTISSTFTANHETAKFDPKRSGQLLVALILVALMGTLAQHLTGGILTEAVVGLNYHTVPQRFASWQAFWTFLFYLYPVERSILSILAAFLAAPVLLSLSSSRIITRLV